MVTLSDVRRQYPQYEDMSDDALAAALHRKFYSDMPRRDFNRAIGYEPQGGQHLTFEEGQRLLEQEEQSGVSGATGAALTSVVDGVPVVGPLALGGTQRAAALIGSMITGQNFDDALKSARKVTQRAQEAHPAITTAGNITGAVAGTLPLVTAAPAAFGAGGGSLAARSIASMISGGSLGGADAAVRSGGDMEEVGKGFGWGAGAGLAGPAVGKAVGKGAKAAVEAIRNHRVAKAIGAKPYALNKLASAFDADNLDEVTARTRLADLGPDGMIADIGDNLRGRTAALANMPGEANPIVRSALETRHRGANARIRSAVDDSLGPNVVPSQFVRVLDENQQALAPRYNEVFRNARNYDISPVADDLDLSIGRLRGDAQRRLRQVRSMLNVEGTDQLSSNPRVFFETRQSIDGMLATEADPKVIRELSEARQMIDDALTRAVPGLKDVDAAYAELARQKDALGRGQQVLDGGRTAPRPSELADEVRAGAQPTGTMVGPSAVPLRLSQGARAEVDRILGNNANDVARLNRLIKSDGDWNRQRLATLFGAEKADRLFKVLDNELTFARTRDFAIGNSATAGRQQHIMDLGGGAEPALIRHAYAAGGVPGAVRGAGLRAADKIYNSIMSGRIERGNKSLAELITSNRADVVDALAKRRMSPEQQRMAEQIAKSLLIGTGASGAR